MPDAAQPVSQPVEPQVPEARESFRDRFAVQRLPSRHRTLLFIGSGLLILLLASFAIRRSTSIAKQTPPVGLSVASLGDQLELRWNAASPLVKDSVNASLLIMDSGDAARVDLSRAQVAAGIYDYKPRGSKSPSR